MSKQDFTTSTGSHLKNRVFFYGPSSATWPVPEGTEEVHVHVWGGGGSSSRSPAGGSAGGAGGGYARTNLVVSDTDTLSITVGGNGGTSSVTVPTQTPGSPISATGGGNATACVGGTGGSGSITLNPTFPTYYCMTASGGDGGTPSQVPAGNTGGGAAGSPLGDGGMGGTACSGCGGGIGQSPGNNQYYTQWKSCNGCGGSFISVYNYSGGSYLSGRIDCNTVIYPASCGWCIYNPANIPSPESATLVLGSAGRNVFMENIQSIYKSQPCGPSIVPVNCTGAFTVMYQGPDADTSRGNEWFYVEDMAGSAAYSWTAGFSGASCNSSAGMGGSSGNTGILGGGGSPVSSCWNTSTAGCAGGGGGPNGPAGTSAPGGPGLVVIYW